MRIKEAYQLVNYKIKKIKLKDFYESDKEGNLLNVYPVSLGIFEGFGGTINESSAYNFSRLNEKDKKKSLELMLGKDGLKYSLFRLCVGSSDFTTHSYCYVEDDDKDLSTFSIKEDKKYIIPFIKEMQAYTKNNIRFMASPWSPPAFMKTNNERKHGGHLKKEYYDLYAEYIIKFLKAYKEEGIDITYLTIQNEQKAIQTWESCVYSKEEEVAFAKVLVNHLAKNNLKVELLCWDHNKERLFERANYALSQCDLFSGSGFHWYSGNHYDVIRHLKMLYPNKKIIETEFCRSYGLDETSTSYSLEFVNNFRLGVNGIIEWCLFLDEKGGPYHDRGDGNCGCDATIHVSNDNKIYFKKNYYETYMFAHFIDRGANMLATSSFFENIKVSAVENPNKDVVVNVVNFEKEDYEGTVYFNNRFIDLHLPKESVTTIVITDII